MNSRITRRFRTLGLTETNDKGKIINYKPQHICWDDSNRRGININTFKANEPNKAKQKGIIVTAKRLGIVGKHAGSKPLYKLEKIVKSIYRRLAEYKKKLKEKEAKNAD